MKIPKCLKCEKELRWELPDSEDDPNPRNATTLDGGGFLEVQFHFGSRYDQCLGMPNRKYRFRYNATEEGLVQTEDRIRLLLSCDRIQAFLCDDCFERNTHLFEGWDEVKEWKIKNERVVE